MPVLVVPLGGLEQRVCFVCGVEADDFDQAQGDVARIGCQLQGAAEGVVNELPEAWACEEPRYSLYDLLEGFVGGSGSEVGSGSSIGEGYCRSTSSLGAPMISVSIWANAPGSSRAAPSMKSMISQAT